MEIKTDAIVLRAADYKDADKILTLLTPSAGKLTAGIKGVKKSGARLAFAAQPFSFCEYVLAEKNGRNTVTSAYQHDGFFPLRTDITRYYAACAVAEIADELSAEGSENEALFIAAAQALRSLAYGEENETPAEALCSFLLTALFEAGYMIDLDGCGACGNEIEKRAGAESGAVSLAGAEKSACYFDFSGGRFLCGNCGAAAGGAGGNLVRASIKTYDFLRKISGISCENTQKNVDSGAKNAENTLKNGDFFDKNGSKTSKNDAELRALRLLKAYLSGKTERDYPCFTEFYRLYRDDFKGDFRE